MENSVKPSLLNRILTPIIMLLSGVAAMAWFFYRIYFLIFGNFESVVLIDKGSYYMLGVGLGFLSLAYVIIWEQWFLKPVDKTVTSIFSWMAGSGVVLIFSLPHIIHYLADYSLTSSGYIVCQDASHQWLFIRDIVYIKDSVECSVDLKTQ